MATSRGTSCIVLIIVLLCAPLSVLGSRVLRGQRYTSSDPSCHLQVTQIRLPWNQLTDQLRSRAAYFESVASNSSLLESFSNSNFAVNPVQLGGGYLSAVSSFTVSVKLGNPGVSVPLIVDTGSHINFVQGSQCITCDASSPSCGNNPYSSSSTCPYSGALYNPSQSSTANTQLSCSQCKASDPSGFVDCLGRAFSPPATCQFGIRYGGGYATGQYLQDTMAIGSVTAANIYFGTAVYESSFDGVAGLLGFGPSSASLPFQLRSSGAASSASFALCLASGQSTGGSLFLGGVPSQLASQPLAYTPILQNPSVYYVIGAPTNFLVGGVSASGAASALATETYPQKTWIVDSGTTLSYLPTALKSAVFAQLATAVGCNNTFVNLQGSGLDFIDLSSCSPPFSSNPTYAEVYSRFPALTLTLPGVSLTARPKGYSILGRYGPQGQSCVNPGIADGGTSGVRIIGDSFMSDNLIVYDNDNQRLGFAPLDCSTLGPLDSAVNSASPPTSAPSPTTVSSPPLSTTAPSSPPPTSASPPPPPATASPTPSPTASPAYPPPTSSSPPPPTADPPSSTNTPLTPPQPTAASAPPPTTPVASNPASVASAPSVPPVSTNSPPASPAPTNSPAATDSPTNPPSAIDVQNNPPPTTGPPPSEALAPTNDPSTEPPAADSAPPTQSAASPPPIIAVPNAPPPAEGATNPASAPPSDVLAAGGLCDPYSSTPNQCYNDVGTFYVCCSGSCPSTPSSTPTCAAQIAAASNYLGGGVCDPSSALPNQCYNDDGSLYTCCAGSCASIPGQVPACA